MYFLRSLSFIPRQLVNQSLLLSYDVYPTLLTRSRPLVGQSPLLPLPLRSRQLVDQSLFLASCFARGNWLISLSSLPLASLEAIGGPVCLRSRSLVDQSHLLRLSLRSRQLVDKPLFLVCLFARGNWLTNLLRLEPVSSSSNRKCVSEP